MAPLTVLGPAPALAQSAGAEFDATRSQAAPVPTAAASSDQSEAIVVTGARGVKRSVGSSATPIDVITSADLQKTGKAGLQEALADLLPSVALPSQAGGDVSSIVRTATIRGLSPDQVLVLVNGKRRHVSSVVNVSGTVGTGSQAVDLNLIPMSAIDHIEVLRDGAAAQYGSDAIAGVINIILKSSDHGGTIFGSGGAYGEGDGITWQTDDDVGYRLGKDGFIHLSYEGIRQDHTSRAIDSTLQYYYNGDPLNNLPKRVTYSGYGIPQQNTQSFAANLDKPLTRGIEAYAFGTYSHNVGMQWENYRQPNNNNAVVGLFPDGYQPREEVIQDDVSATVGLRGDDLFGWKWDLSSTYGRNYAEILVLNSVNPTYGVNSPTQFRNGAWESSEITNDFDLTRAFKVPLLAKPLNVAMGVEQRVDNYRIVAGEPASYNDGGVPILTGPNRGQFLDVPGSQSFNGFLPSQTANLWRNNVGGYVDLETSILPQWQLGVAGRFEHYNDFGNNKIGKVSTRYEVAKWLAFRGAISNGFRAPSLGEEGFQSSTTSFYKGVPYNSVNLPVYSPGAEALGAQNLRPETSIDYSAGIVLNPVRHMTVTVDGYQVGIANRIVESGYIGLSPSGVLDPGVASLLKSEGVSGVDAARYFLNGARTRTRGVDIVADYRSDFRDYGRVLWSLGLNLNEARILSLTDLARRTVFGTQVFNSQAQHNLTETSPKNNLSLGANWSRGPFSVIIREHRWGSLVATSTVTGGDSFLSPHWTTDLDIGYMPLPRLRISIGAQNLFNAYPDRTNALNFSTSTFNGAGIYNANSPYGISGGFYYLHGTYRF
ncbi:TonB-dependent receptor plug domain-containing protein [Lichenicoccus sp.]|uniref:TonB-dependent receptor plug domain-containing protein n=1 Tax=Lichenicoccus sp. TaxID=2781899 RepID=UPI003D10D42D